MSFTVALTTVIVMLVYAVPGFLLVRFRKLDAGAIPTVATFLLYCFSPIQMINAIQKAPRTAEMLGNMVLAVVLGFVLLGGLIAIAWLLLRRRQDEVPVRICTVAAAMGNVGFMGIPLMEALLPEYPQVIAFAGAFFVSYNVLMWTVVSFVITRDRKYISLRNILLNPSVIAFAVAMVLLAFDIRFTGQAADIMALFAKLATVSCMLIMGMRLALVPFKSMFTSGLQYLTVALKLIVFPLLVLLAVKLVPMDDCYRRGVYIMCSCPVGNLVLTFAELLGEGQDTACNVVLLSTLLSMITIPVMMMLA